MLPNPESLGQLWQEAHAGSHERAIWTAMIRLPLAGIALILRLGVLGNMRNSS